MLLSISLRNMRMAVVIERVKLENGQIDWVCNCCYPMLPSGVKGKVCPHVYLMYISDNRVQLSKKTITEGSRPKGRPPNKKNQPTY